MLAASRYKLDEGKVLSLGVYRGDWGLVPDGLVGVVNGEGPTTTLSTCGLHSPCLMSDQMFWCAGGALVPLMGFKSAAYVRGRVS